MLRQDRATADARTRERGLVDIVARVKRSRGGTDAGASQSRGTSLNDRGGCDAGSGSGSDHDAGNGRVCGGSDHGPGSGSGSGSGRSRVEDEGGDDDDECVRRLARALSAPIAEVRRAWASAPV
jgi:hypothetical protein